MKKIISVILVLLIGIFVLGSCKDKESPYVSDDSKSSEKRETFTGKKPVATIELTDGGKIVVELDPNVAPNTVNNFIELSNAGFYDGLIFHRVIKDFMIQGGDPQGNGQGGPGYTIKGEFTDNGFKNELSHVPGTISMARSSDMDSGGSQFFIVTGDATFLDGQYAGFGTVKEGLEKAVELSMVPTDGNDKPVTDVVIKSIKIENNDYSPKEVVKIK